MADRWHVGCRACPDRGESITTPTHRHGDYAEDGYELRYQRNGRNELTLDEVVARGVDVHLEQMSGDSWWLGIDLPDTRRIMVSIGRRKSKVHAAADIEPPSERPAWAKHAHDARIQELRDELIRLERERAVDVRRQNAEYLRSQGLVGGDFLRALKEERADG